ncbi:MAG: hypothetical protein QM296_02340 [Bacillota bacterium]|nr:hypothetical protein [Bacillota bacterium]
MQNAFDGAILMVSHDRCFLAEVCARLLKPRPDELHELDVSEWREWQTADADQGAAVRAA